MVRVKAVADVVKRTIVAAHMAKPFWLMNMKGELREQGVELTDEQIRDIQEVLKRHYKLWSDTWIINPLHKILHILKEEPHEFKDGVCRVCGEWGPWPWEEP